MSFRNSSRRRGSALLEGALCLSLMAAFLIGIMDIAKVLFLHQGLVERARAGANWAATRPFDAVAIKNVVVYNSTTAGTGSIIYQLTPSLVSATLLEPDTVRARVEVRITNYPFEFVTPGLSGSFIAGPVVATLTHEPSLP